MISRSVRKKKVYFGREDLTTRTTTNYNLEWIEGNVFAK